MDNKNKIYRSSKDKKIAGVAAGLADYFNIDPVIVRILFVLGFILGGSGLILYILLWIIVPEEENNNNNNNLEMPDNEYKKENEREINMSEENKSKNVKNQGSLTAGLILISVGVLFLIDRFIPEINFADLWPVILIVIGLALIINSKKKNNNSF